jgi:hypothetical protein
MLNLHFDRNAHRGDQANQLKQFFNDEHSKPESPYPDKLDAYSHRLPNAVVRVDLDFA